MINILPSKDSKIKKKCCPETDCAEALISREKGQEIGYICVEQIDSILKIIGMELYYCPNTEKLSQKDRIDGDCLVRAAGSYAWNRDISVMECEKKELFHLLVQLGFQQIDDKVMINLSQLFKPCKN